jgi:CheY-like chemotaxis protein
MKVTPISVMLVDDNPVFLRATSQFLEAHDDVVVVGTANGGDKALERVEGLHPQVVLIDLAMPGLPGLETIPHLRRMMPNLRIIALTVMNSPSFRQAALAAGADVFLAKANMRTDLLPAIRQLMRVDKAKVAKTLPSLSGNGSAEPRRILVIEDDSHLRRLYSKALGKAGYEVYSSGTIEESRALLAQTRFDVLLCDIQLGEDHGIDLLSDYASTLATSGAQVIMVSGHSHYRDLCAELGVDFFLEKPVSISTLVDLVKRLTARR